MLRKRERERGEREGGLYPLSPRSEMKAFHFFFSTRLLSRTVPFLSALRLPGTDAAGQIFERDQKSGRRR